MCSISKKGRVNPVKGACVQYIKKGRVNPVKGHKFGFLTLTCPNLEYLECFNPKERFSRF